MDARFANFAAADAKARFSELLDRAEQGEELTISRHGKAVARLVPVEAVDPIAVRRASRLAFLKRRDARPPRLAGPTSLELIHEARNRLVR